MQGLQSILDRFFLFGDVPPNAEFGTYIPYLVVLSYIIASLGSFTGLRFAGDIQRAETKKVRSLLHWGGAFSFGIGIWSMHFIGMLAYDLDMALTYDPFLTGLSMVIAIIVAYGVLVIARKGTLNWTDLVSGALLLGVAICGMHYTGMAAMEMDGDIRYKPGLFTLSYVIAATASGAALWIVFKLGRQEGHSLLVSQIVAALVMGAAICGMHYTGMAATVFIPWVDCRYDPDQSFDSLALAVAGGSSLIFGLALATAFYNQEKTIVHSPDKDAFPARLLITALMITLVSAVWMGSKNFYFYKTITSNIQEQTRVSRLSYKVMRLDGILTESARMAAATGKVEWEDRYNSHVGELDKVIQELQTYSASVMSGDDELSVNQTKNANKELVSMEKRVFDLVRQGREDEAQEIMESVAYNKNKKIYAAGMDQFIRNAVNAANVSTSALVQSLYYSLFPVIAAIIILGIVWFFVLHRIQRWRRELVATRNTLQKEKAYLSAIMDNMRQGVVTIDKNGIVQSCNNWAEFIFGYKEHEMQGRNVKMLMPSPYKENHDQYIKNYLETGQAQIIDTGREVEALKKNGETFPVYLNVMDIKMEDGLFFVGLIMDFTEQKEKEKALRHARKEAVQANQAKSDFLANMSHELRTPLNSILGMSRMNAEDPHIPDENREMAENVHKSALSLLEIVNDILDISKIESGNMVLEEILFDLKDTVATVMETIAPIASSKGITLKYDFKNKYIPYLIGDPLRVSRILTNLISNAIKYTDKGDVDITIVSRKVENDSDLLEIYFEVRDTGIGIPEDKFTTIFEKFSQADISAARKYGGTGLGLAITKELVELMGGTIGVESKLGEGSTFWFRIPFETTDKLDESMQTWKDHKEERHTEDAYLVPGETRVLVAEDHLLNQDFIKRLLERMGFETIDMVENGDQALDAYEEKKHDLILMDCHMPGINGYEATQILRREENRQNVPIVALTADAMKGTQEKCLECGMNDYVSKPIDVDEFRAVLSQWVRFPKEISGSEPVKRTNGFRQQKGNGEPPVDMALLEEYAETPEDMKNFISVFIKQSTESLSVLEENCTDGDNQQWVEAAHKLKGGAGMIGAEKLKTLCAKAQAMKKVTAEDRKKILKIISKKFQRIKDYLEDVTSV